MPRVIFRFLRLHFLSLIFAGLIFLVFFFPILTWTFRDAIPATDDGEYHLARIANYYLALKQDQFPPRWAPNLNGGFGYPLFIFAYHLPYLLSVAFFVGFSVTIQQSFNLVVTFSTLVGFLGAYVLVRQKNVPSLYSFFLALTYSLSPYLLINIFSRGAFGEIVFFGAAPWVLVFMERFVDSSRIKVWNGLGLIAATTAALLSHLPSALWLFPLAFGDLVLSLLERTQRNKKEIFRQLLITIIPLGIAALLVQPVLFPAFAEQQYVWLPNHPIFRDFWMQYPKFPEVLLRIPQNAQVLATKDLISVGLFSYLGVITALGVFLKMKQLPLRLWYWLGVFVLCIALMHPASRPVWELIPPLKVQQFPWRLLGAISLASLQLCAFVFTFLRTRFRMIFLVLLIGSAALSVRYFARPRGEIRSTDYGWFEYFKTATSFDEYQPIWSHEYTPRTVDDEKAILRERGKKLFRGKSDYRSLAGMADEITFWNGVTMDYTVIATQSADVLQKTIYYPGWKVWVDGRLVEIQYQDDEFPGRIIFPVSEGQHRITAQFTQDIWTFPISWTLFGFGGIALIVYILLLCSPSRQEK